MSQNVNQRISAGHENSDKVVRIAPNCSLTRYQARVFFQTLIVSTALVSGSMAIAGYWLVLPFAGLELVAIGIALRISMKRGRYQEVLRISDKKIVVEKGELDVQERVEFPRYWVTVKLIPSRVESYPSRLVLACQGRTMEIGQCLTESERVGLERRLVVLLRPGQ